jgi:hypothetical protein
MAASSDAIACLSVATLLKSCSTKVRFAPKWDSTKFCSTKVIPAHASTMLCNAVELLLKDKAQKWMGWFNLIYLRVGEGLVSKLSLRSFIVLIKSHSLSLWMSPIRVFLGDLLCDWILFYRIHEKQICLVWSDSVWSHLGTSMYTVLRVVSTVYARNIKNKRRKGHLLISHLAAWTALARKSCDVANQQHHLVQ